MELLEQEESDNVDEGSNEEAEEVTTVALATGLSLLHRLKKEGVAPEVVEAEEAGGGGGERMGVEEQGAIPESGEPPTMVMVVRSLADVSSEFEQRGLSKIEEDIPYLAFWSLSYQRLLEGISFDGKAL